MLVPRYRGDQLGLAIELGHTGFGHAHAFLPDTARELHAALGEIGQEMVAARAQHIAEHMEWAHAVNEVPEDMEALRKIVDEAIHAGKGLMWYWA